MSELSPDEPLARGKHLGPAGREVPAEDAPAGPATFPFGVAQPWQGPDCLVLRVPLWNVLLGCACLPALLLVPSVIFVAVLAFDRVFLAGWPQVQLWVFRTAVVFGALLTALWMAWEWYIRFLLPRVTFDKAAGVLALGWKGRLGRRPLSSVVGVQVMQTRKQKPAPNLPGFAKYQMNLILDDSAERRLHVLTFNLETARSTARLVADFLGVPVLDSAGAEGNGGGPAPKNKIPEQGTS